MTRLRLAGSGASVLALGSDLKQTLCLLHGEQGEISEPLANLELPDDFLTAHRTAESMLNRSGFTPEAIACDLHPDMLSRRLATSLAERLGVPLIPVQHHHAHVAAIAAEHGVKGPLIGLALDGFGYGSDGHAWGGELLLLDRDQCSRIGAIKPVAMPGGDAASREPWRMAVSHLQEELGVEAGRLLPRLFPAVSGRIGDVLDLCNLPHTPLTSSTGRLFDAAAAIVLEHYASRFEAEAPIALEAATGSVQGEPLPFAIIEAGMPMLDAGPALAELARQRLDGAHRQALAAAFHATLVEGLAALVIAAAERHGIFEIALAGGCFANRYLAAVLPDRLRAAGLSVLLPQSLPSGDAAISLGQAWVARQTLAAWRE